jgi:EAL domain-containing protein (putative c-di-GMP-specific phosphodiesterase class I)
VPPRQLVLELTESMLMDRVDTTAAKLTALRALGVELSIDDFGTGYSSMSYLKQFPVQELKIDRSFIMGTPHDRTDSAIVRALIVLGHSLGMRVVAEGVENELQRDSLQALQCDSYQGFLCSPALPPHLFIEKLKQVNAAAGLAQRDTRASGLPEAPGDVAVATLNESLRALPGLAHAHPDAG